MSKEIKLKDGWVVDSDVLIDYIFDNYKSPQHLLHATTIANKIEDAEMKQFILTAIRRAQTIKQRSAPVRTSRTTKSSQNYTKKFFHFLTFGIFE